MANSNTSLYPTIFIGIGTTGAEILASLQKYLVEEYQTNSFPIFYLLGLVSDDSDRGKCNNAYDIDWYHMQIPHTKDIKESVREARLDWQRNLKKWLPEKTFDYDCYMNGAGGRRAIGRLFLWNNFEEISRRIDNAKSVISNTDARSKARAILANRFKVNIDVKSEIRAYIFGSLGGGTCSGMCIDAAYLVSSILKENKKSITGIFTIPDYRYATDVDNSLNTNAYAAITELSYYFYYSNQPKPITHYLYDKEIENIVPFDNVYLETTTNKNNISFLDENGMDFDYKSLCDMIGMNLFLACGTETSSKLDGVRVDYFVKRTPGGAEYMLPDPLIGEPRAFTTFGMTSINYPLYSLTRAAACDILRKKFEARTTTGGNSSDLSLPQLVASVDEKWKSFTDSIKNKIIGNYENELREKVNEVYSRIMSPNTQAVDIENTLRSFPEKESFSKQFAPGGDYYQKLEHNANKFKKEILQDAYKVICTLKEGSSRIEEYHKKIELFKEKIEKAIKQGQKEARIAFDALDGYINKVAEIEKDWFHKFVGQTNESIAFRKNQICNGYCQLIISAFNKLRQNFTIELFKEIKAQYLDEDAPDGILKQIKAIQRKYIDLIDFLDKEKDGIYQQFHSMPHMMFCSETRLYGKGTENQQLIDWATSEVQNIAINNSDYLEDEKIYAAFIDKPGVSAPSLREFEADLRSKLDRDFNSACSKMVDCLASTIMQKKKVKINFAELFRNVTNQEALATLEENLKRSFWYAQLEPYYYNGKTERFKFNSFEGCHVKLLPQSLSQAKEVLGKIGTFKGDIKWTDIDLNEDHWIGFYTEEIGFAPSHLRAYNEWKKNYEKHLEKNPNSKDFDWTEPEWRNTRIDFLKEARTELIQFILENVNRLYPNNTLKTGNGIAFFKTWEQTGDYYFDVPKKDVELSYDIHIDLHNADSYANAARIDFNPNLEKYLIDKLSACFCNLSFDEFEKLCDKYVMDIEQEIRSGRIKDLGPDDAKKQRISWEWDSQNVNVFKVFIKKKFYTDLSVKDDEKQLLTKNFKKDPKDDDDKRIFTFSFLNRFLYK